MFSSASSESRMLEPSSGTISSSVDRSLNYGIIRVTHVCVCVFFFLVEVFVGKQLVVACEGGTLSVAF